jgi:hypothetical protein
VVSDLSSLANDHPIFWRAVNNNFLDMCVLEWCKLFTDKSRKHYWGNIVTDSQKFETEPLRYLGLDTAAFEKEIKTMRYYRDKFVAHQDLEYIVILPTLDVAKKAVWCYHAHLVNHLILLSELLVVRSQEHLSGGMHTTTAMATP